MWLVLVLFSALLLGGATLLMKRDVMHEPTTQMIALYPLSGALVVAFLKPEFGVILTSTGVLITVKAIVLGFALYLSMRALERLPVSLYAPLRNLSPITLLILGTLLLGEHVGLIQVVGLVILVASTTLLDVDVRQPGIRKQLKRFVKDPAVMLMGLYAIVLSFAPILDRLILRGTTPVTDEFYTMLLVAALFWIVHLVKERQLPIKGLSPIEGLWLVLTGIVIAFSDVALFTAMAIPGTLLVVLIGVRRLSTLFATLAGGVFREEHVLYKGGVCLLMIAGTVLLLL